MNQHEGQDDCERDSDGQAWENDESETWFEEGVSELEVTSDYRPYTPRLMDTQEMQALRVALNRSEMQIQQQGHMKEYDPRNPRRRQAASLVRPASESGGGAPSHVGRSGVTA